MATSSRSAASKPLPLALELLIADHRKVERLFDRYEDEKDSDEDGRRALAQRICAELTVHTQLEEELFYPWLRENLDEESMDLVDEAIVEHGTAKDLIAQIEGAAEVDETYDARVTVLGEYVRHHVREEENEIFPQVQSMQEELDELGQEIAARKTELMDEQGLGMDEDEMAGMAAQARGRASQAAQRSR